MINWQSWKSFGLTSILKDGPSGKSITLNTKVILHLISGEGIVGYLTSNLKNGHIRNIDHFRKYCFATHGIYGVEGNYEIDGVWMWRGTEIPMEWKEHQSYDYFTFTKMDPKNEADQKLAEEYWLNLKEGDIVEGKPVFDADWFKWPCSL